MAFKYIPPEKALMGILEGKRYIRVAKGKYLLPAQVTPTLGKLFRAAVLKQIRAMRRIPPDRWFYSGGMFRPRVSYNKARDSFDFILEENRNIPKEFNYWRVFERGRPRRSIAEIRAFWGECETHGSGRRGTTVRRLFYKRTTEPKYRYYKKFTKPVMRIHEGTASKISRIHKQVIPAMYTWYYELHDNEGGVFERAVPIKKRIVVGTTLGTSSKEDTGVMRSPFGMVKKFRVGKKIGEVKPKPFVGELATRVLKQLKSELIAMGWDNLPTKISFGGSLGL